MDRAERLITFLDVAQGAGAPLERESAMSLSALHQLELTSGRRVVLLDDRGWSCGGAPDIWARVSLEEMAEISRAVVGPDEPPPGHSLDEATAAHWAHLAATAREHGVQVEAGEIAALPHHVEISQNVRTRAARSAT